MLTLRDAIEAYASDGRRAYPITRELFDGIIAALHRDERFRDMPVLDLELLLADARRNTERRLVRELRGRVRIEDLGEAV